MGLFSGISNALFGKTGYMGDMELQERLARERQQKATDYAQEQLQPYSDVGGLGLTRLQQYMGLGGDASSQGYGSLMETYSPDKFAQDPSYQFRLDEGQKGIERAMAARGKTFSPEAVKALADYNQRMASQEYGSAYDRYTADQTNTYNRLASIVGMGQTQAANLGNLELGNAAQISNFAMNLENARQAAAEGRANRAQGMFNTLVGAGASYFGGK